MSLAVLNPVLVSLFPHILIHGHNPDSSLIPLSSPQLIQPCPLASVSCTQIHPVSTPPVFILTVFALNFQLNCKQWLERVAPKPLCVAHSSALHSRHSESTSMHGILQLLQLLQSPVSQVGPSQCPLLPGQVFILLALLKYSVHNSVCQVLWEGRSYFRFPLVAAGDKL